MRIERLELIRYGRFTDHVVDFGPRPDSDRSDLHIVYGPNEAGKSTLFSAWLDLLYKIPTKTSYAFLHPANRLAVGGRLDLGGHAGGPVQTVVRTLQNQGALQDQHGNPLPESVIAAALGGFGRDDYTRSFSLDDETLEKGGDGILRSEGELGKLLFSSSAGLASVADVLEQVAAEADAIHKLRSQSSEIARLKKERDELLAELKQRDTGAADYERLVKAARQAVEAYETVAEALGRSQAALKETSRLVQGMSCWASIQRLHGALAPLEPLPTYPEAWAKELAALERDLADLRMRRGETAVLVGRLQRELAEISADPVLLARQREIDQALETQDRFTTALRDLSARERELAAVRETLADIRHRLGAPDSVRDRELLFPARVTSRLRDLIEQRSGLLSALQSARTEVEEAEARSAEIAVEQAALPAALDLTDLERVRGEVAEAMEGLGLAELEQRSATAARRLEDALAALAPWRGGPDDLLALAVPSDTHLAERKAALTAAREAVRRSADRLTEADEALAAAQDALQAAESEAAGIDDETAASVRAERDRLWRAHAEAITAVCGGTRAPQTLETSADAFTGAMAADDQVTTDRLRRVQAVEEHRQARRRHAEADRSRTAALRQAAAARESLAALCADFSRLQENLGLPAEGTPEALADWLGRRTVALERRAELRELEARAKAARAEMKTLETALRQALVPVAEVTGIPVPPNAPLPTLRALAERVCTEARAAAGARAAATKRLAEAERDRRRRAKTLAEAETAQTVWAEAWRGMIAETWLGRALDRLPDSSEMREILAELDRLQPALQQIRTLEERITKMRQDKDAFAGQMVALMAALAAAGLGPEQQPETVTLPVTGPLDATDSTAVRQTADWLRGALDQARRSSNSRDQKTKELADAEETLADIDRRLQRHHHRLEEMGRHFQVDGAEALRAAMEQADRKRQLSRDLATWQDELVRLLAVPSLVEAEEKMAAALATEDAAESLRDQLAHQEDEVARLNNTVQTAYHDKREAERLLEEVGGDDAVTRLEERIKALDLQTRDAIDRYLRLKIGTLAAEEALRRYRDRHRSEMMALAGQAFRTITGGRFAGLTSAQQTAAKGKTGEVVLARRADGSTLAAQEMSKGTRFQLYLALRIAGYQQLATLRGDTLPFIADDILETADDQRSRHALEMLAEMARAGQVIYLTHHWHLVEQARAVAGHAVTVHELPAPFLERVR